MCDNCIYEGGKSEKFFIVCMKLCMSLQLQYFILCMPNKCRNNYRLLASLSTSWMLKSLQSAKTLQLNNYKKYIYMKKKKKKKYIFNIFE